MDEKGKFLLQEYKTAAQLTFHIDELRNKLTSFFLSFTGLAAAGLLLLIKGETAEKLGNPLSIISILLFILSVIGFLVVFILAKLRRVQIEHFRIINNVRKYFLGNDYSLWNLVQLSAKTMPTPNRKSGTYYWLCMIMLVTSAMIGMATYLLLKEYSILQPGSVCFISVLIASIGILFQDKLYFSMSTPSLPLPYSQTDSL